MLKRERIKRRIYPTKEAARADAFDYIEMFYNPKRRYGSNGPHRQGAREMKMLKKMTDFLEAFADEGRQCFFEERRIKC